MSDDLYNDIKNFEVSLTKSARMLETDPLSYPPPTGAIIGAAIMVSKAIILLARTNRQAKRA